MLQQCREAPAVAAAVSSSSPALRHYPTSAADHTCPTSSTAVHSTAQRSCHITRAPQARSLRLVCLFRCLIRRVRRAGLCS